MEIGGYLEFERYHGEEFHKTCLKLNTGRNCLKYLIEAKDIKKLWLSRWNCSAVLDTCRECGIEIAYYALDEELRPILPNNYKKEDYVYVVNYYGQVTDVHFEHTIMDNVQAFFEEPQKGVDTIYTCRKYFGVTDGAYLYTDCEIGRKLDQDFSYKRISYLAGRMEKSGSDFYSSYQENEKLLDNLPLLEMSAFTENILRSINYEFVKKKREDNYKYLHKRLGHLNLLQIKYPVGPFAYPLKIDDGNKMRKKLQEKGIYVAKLWPNIEKGPEALLADNILPIPCDQRYSEVQMESIVDIISSFLE